MVLSIIFLCCKGDRRKNNIVANTIRNPVRILNIIAFLFLICGVTFEIIRSLNGNRLEKMPHTNQERLQRWSNQKEREARLESLYDDWWYAAPPKREFGYVCQIPSLHPEDRVPGSDAHPKIPVQFNDGNWCPSGWDGPITKKGPYCYKAFSSRVTHFSAQKKCASLNVRKIWRETGLARNRRRLKQKLLSMRGRLVQIESDLENKQVHYTCGGRQSCWIGLRSTVKKWMWTDRETSSEFEMFTNTEDARELFAAFISKGPEEDGAMTEELAELLFYEKQETDDQEDIAEEGWEEGVDTMREEDQESKERLAQLITNRTQEIVKKAKKDAKDRREKVKKIIQEVQSNHQEIVSMTQEQIRVQTERMVNRTQENLMDAHEKIVQTVERARKKREKNKQLAQENIAKMQEKLSELRAHLKAQIEAAKEKQTDPAPSETSDGETEPPEIIPGDTEYVDEPEEKETEAPPDYSWYGEGAATAEFSNKWHDALGDHLFPAVCEYLPTDGVCARLPINLYTVPKIFKKTNHCYARLNTPMTYYTARSTCESISSDGHLVHIEDDDENNFVWHICGRGIQPCWIGLHEYPQSEEWNLDGKVTEEDNGYRNWDEGQPDNYNGVDEDAAFIGFSWSWFERQHYDDWWWKSAPQQQYPFVCEIDQAVCGSDWAGPYRVEEGSRCYKFVDEPRAQGDADLHCRKLGGYLTFITSELENYIVSEMCGGSHRLQPCWIGIYYLETGYKSFGDVKLTDESYTKWWNGVGSSDVTETGVMMGWVNTAELPLPTWFDVRGNWHFPFICELEKPDTGCPKYWNEWNHSCYKKYDVRKKYYDALKMCKEDQQDSYVVNIETPEENRLVSHMCGGRTPCWIGLQEDEEYWGKWYWYKAEGGPKRPLATYINWAENEPNNWNNGDEKFAFIGWYKWYFDDKMYEKEGRRRQLEAYGSKKFLGRKTTVQKRRQLDDNPETPQRRKLINVRQYDDGTQYDSFWYGVQEWLHFPFICEMPKVSRCPKDYTVANGSCYLAVLKLKLPFWEAQDYCISKNGYLVTIESEEENKYIRKLCGDGRFPCWIGIEMTVEDAGKRKWKKIGLVASDSDSLIDLDTDFTKFAGEFYKNKESYDVPTSVILGYNYRYFETGQHKFRKKWSNPRDEANAPPQDLFPHWYDVPAYYYAQNKLIFVISNVMVSFFIIFKLPRSFTPLQLFYITYVELLLLLLIIPMMAAPTLNFFHVSFWQTKYSEGIPHIVLSYLQFIIMLSILRRTRKLYKLSKRMDLSNEDDSDPSKESRRPSTPEKPSEDKPENMWPGKGLQQQSIFTNTIGVIGKPVKGMDAHGHGTLTEGATLPPTHVRAPTPSTQPPLFPEIDEPEIPMYPEVDEPITAPPLPEMEEEVPELAQPVYRRSIVLENEDEDIPLEGPPVYIAHRSMSDVPDCPSIPELPATAPALNVNDEQPSKLPNSWNDL